MYRCSGEMEDHLLIHCETAYASWSEMFMMFGIQLGVAGQHSIPPFWQVELARKTFFECMELGASEHDMVSVE